MSGLKWAFWYPRSCDHCGKEVVPSVVETTAALNIGAEAEDAKFKRAAAENNMKAVHATTRPDRTGKILHATFFNILARCNCRRFASIVDGAPEM
jgi:hypothetical protein